jgi:hypothetical protein
MSSHSSVLWGVLDYYHCTPGSIPERYSVRFRNQCPGTPPSCAEQNRADENLQHNFSTYQAPNCGPRAFICVMRHPEEGGETMLVAQRSIYFHLTRLRSAKEMSRDFTTFHGQDQSPKLLPRAYFSVMRHPPEKESMTRPLLSYSHTTYFFRVGGCLPGQTDTSCWSGDAGGSKRGPERLCKKSRDTGELR